MPSLELPHYLQHPPVHGEFGTDQQGHRNKKAHVSFDVEQERDVYVVANHIAVPNGEQQQRQPGDRRKDDDTSPQQRQRIVRQVRPAQQLEQRATHDDGEVRRRR